MFVSMDFEVTGDITPEEALRAVQAYMASYDREGPIYTVDIHRRGDNKIQVQVEQTLARVGYNPAPLPGE